MNRAGDSLSVPGEPSWASREVAAMAAAFERGERVSAAAILQAHPEIDSESAIRLIYEEVCLRREAGEDVKSAEVIARFPEFADDLDALFECDRLIGGVDKPIAFPEVGESVLSFLLFAELGRGASGRTFLATDTNLADRPVVLKMIPDDQEEHLALATLRHTHIVPLFYEEVVPERGLRVLCMPYLGGASLSQILADLAKVPADQLTGQSIVSVIEKNTLRIPGVDLPSDSPFRRKLESEQYLDAVVWITACLADGLQYAHDRKLIHMDIKPSNVLITLDGQPILLDFHLAHKKIKADEWVVDRLGGSQGYMSPEQQRALEAVSLGRAVPDSVDERTDIYALGLLLCDLLFVPKPDPKRPLGKKLPESPLTPAISTGLNDIIVKCLKPDARDRYQDAGALADDLRRHLNHLPLKGVGNRGWKERLSKWKQRRPSGPAWVAAGSIFCVAVGLTSLAYRQAAEDLNNKILRADLLRSNEHYDEALQTLKEVEGKHLWIFGQGILQRRNRERLLVNRERLARDLHEVADLCRLDHGLELPSDRDAKRLVESCRILWDRRRILDPPSGDDEDNPELNQQIRTDLLEVAAFLHDLRRKLDAKDPETRLELKAMLTSAIQEYGESFAIRERLAALEETSLERPSAPPKPSSPFDHYDRGRALLREGRLKEAADEFGQTLDALPLHFWANYYKGECDYRLARFEQAVTDFHSCILINPNSARSYHDRAKALQAVKRVAEAERDYKKAVELDPTLAPAWLNRGIIAYHDERLDEAAGCLESGIEALHDRASDADRETLGLLHYNLALVEHARDNRNAALFHANRAEQLGRTEASDLKRLMK